MTQPAVEILTPQLPAMAALHLSAIRILKSGKTMDELIRPDARIYKRWLSKVSKSDVLVKDFFELWMRASS